MGIKKSIQSFKIQEDTRDIERLFTKLRKSQIIMLQTALQIAYLDYTIFSSLASQLEFVPDNYKIEKRYWFLLKKNCKGVKCFALAKCLSTKVGLHIFFRH